MDDKNTQDIIKSRLAELPEDVRKAITATDLPTKFDAISKKFSLRIDQSGALQTETVLIMLGLENSSDFIRNLMENGEMSRELATTITAEVNTQILNNIRGALREMEDAKDAADKALENPGQTTATSTPAPTITSTEHKDAIIESIENPAPDMNLPVNILTKVPAPQVAPTTPSPAPALVNRLMTTPTATTNDSVTKVVTPIQPISRSGPDPYREAIN